MVSSNFSCNLIFLIHFHFGFVSDFSAKEAIAWMRLCRPGSVLGHQQHFLLMFVIYTHSSCFDSSMCFRIEGQMRAIFRGRLDTARKMAQANVWHLSHH